MTTETEEIDAALRDFDMVGYHSDFVPHSEYFDRHRETIRKALTAAKAMQWQPIETAPRDGTHVLLGVDIATEWIVRNGYWNNGEFYDEQGYETQEEITGWWSYRNSVATEMLQGIYEPTHWMPLPEQPSKGEY